MTYYICYLAGQFNLYTRIGGYGLTATYPAEDIAREFPEADLLSLQSAINMPGIWVRCEARRVAA